MGKKSLLEKFKESEGVYDVPVRDFDIDNMSDDQHDQMLGDVYGGYKTKKVPRYETRGAGRNGMAEVQTGYDDEINYDYYKNNKAWQQTADAVGISGAINNEQELGKMAHYITQYGMDKGDNMPEQMPEAEAPAAEPEKTITTSPQVQKAQNLVDSYKNGIMSGSTSPYKTFIDSPTPNLNTQGENVFGAYDTNTFTDPEFTDADTTGPKAADRFLKGKKIQLGA